MASIIKAIACPHKRHMSIHHPLQTLGALSNRLVMGEIVDLVVVLENTVDLDRRKLKLNSNQEARLSVVCQTCSDALGSRAKISSRVVSKPRARMPSNHSATLNQRVAQALH